MDETIWLNQTQLYNIYTIYKLQITTFDQILYHELVHVCVYSNLIKIIKTSSKLSPIFCLSQLVKQFSFYFLNFVLLSMEPIKYH